MYECVCWVDAKNSMRITLSVLLATLTIYCNSSVLSLPPSLIATAASTQQHYASQIRDKRGSNAADAPPPPHEREAVRSKKETKFRLNGKNIATNGYANKNADANSDDITRLPNYELNSNVGYQMTHPNEVQSILAAAAKDAHERRAVSNDVDHLNEIAEFKRKLPSENDLNALLANAADRLGVQRIAAAQQTRQQQQLEPPTTWTIDAASQMPAMLMKKFFTPLRYWTHHCQPADRNCLQEYYRALHTDRSKAAAAAAKQIDDYSIGTDTAETVEDGNNDDDDVNMNAHTFAFGADYNGNSGGGGGGDPFGNFNDDAAIDSVYNEADIGGGGQLENEDNNASNDILMLLSGEQDVMKFLSWAMSHLYPYQHFANLSGNSAEYYHPGMFNWKKLNLSGRLEPPIVVDEPHYVIVRREPLEEDMKEDMQYKGDPFIPPRGRKHNMPDLDALLNRYETFVPNRGKRDKINDIFKYDDLFFPNRGKKQKPSKAFNDVEMQRNCEQESGEVCGADGFVNEGSIDNRVDESDDSSLTASPHTNAMRDMLAVLKKRLRAHQPYMSWPKSSAKGGINFYRNSDDSLSSNYVDTMDSNLIGDGDSKSADDKAEDEDSAAVWLPDNSNSVEMLTSNPTNENAQSVKSSIPQVISAINTLNDNEDPAAKAARMRRVAGTYGGAPRVAANRMRLAPPMTPRQRLQQQRAALKKLLYNLKERTKQKQKQKQQNFKGILNYINRHIKREPLQAQRRATAHLSLRSNQVRDNSNDMLDLLPLRQLQQIQQEQKKDNKRLTFEHLPMAWLQHMSMSQAHHPPQEQLLGGIDGVAVGRNPPEAANIERL